ncbi:UNVERIFIED_CONTAM: hypothetical protein Sangu_2451300 [Sesamum angustifolium]|uniref:Uncharacterized protein n=1 Tax=Sesamum angustifolium TaxID=2727405 RepID=A0AAW2KWZ1_9LAMI
MRLSKPVHVALSSGGGGKRSYSSSLLWKNLHLTLGWGTGSRTYGSSKGSQCSVSSSDVGGGGGNGTMSLSIAHASHRLEDLQLGYQTALPPLVLLVSDWDSMGVVHNLLHNRIELWFPQMALNIVYQKYPRYVVRSGRDPKVSGTDVQYAPRNWMEFARKKQVRTMPGGIPMMALQQLSQ